MGKNAKRRRELRDTAPRGVSGSPKGANRQKRRRINQILSHYTHIPAKAVETPPPPPTPPANKGTVKADQALADQLGYTRRPSGVYAPAASGEAK